jgi:hypothetical protein
MLAPFLTAEKQAIVFGPRDCGEIVSGKLGRVLPVHHEGDLRRDPGSRRSTYCVQPRPRRRIETNVRYWPLADMG